MVTPCSTIIRWKHPNIVIAAQRPHTTRIRMKFIGDFYSSASAFGLFTKPAIMLIPRPKREVRNSTKYLLSIILILVISLGYTIIYERTMMVHDLDTAITILAMGCAWWSMYLAGCTKSPVRLMWPFLLHDGPYVLSRYDSRLCNGC